MPHNTESKASLLDLLPYKTAKTKIQNFSSVRNLDKMWPWDTSMVLKENAMGTMGFTSTLIVKVFLKA